MKIALIVILIAFSGIFSATETAFSSVNKIRLKNYAASGNRRAERALKIANRFEKALTAILVGNNIVNILSASLGTVIFTDLLGESGVGVSTVVMTLLVLTFGEILPKSIAKEHAESFALFISGFLSFIMTLFTPIVWFFTLLQKLAAKIFKSSGETVSVTEDELKYIIEEIEEQGVLEEQESDLVKSALEFDEIQVSEILVPRVRIVAADITDDIDEIKAIFLRERYSRLPVYEKTVDSIVGIIHEKDFFHMLEEGGELQDIIQDALYIPETKPISEVMKEMQRRKTHMAIVVDQYGGTQGLVTLEDIIEELVGEIYDENDEADNSMTKLPDGSYEVSAELSLHDMLQKLDMPEDIIESDGNSLGGWVCELLGHIPENGESVSSGIFRLTVLSANGQRVEKVRLEIEDGEEEDEGKE